MHWTALLARRQFPPDARIRGDLDCIGCGYNLYSARVGGACPECGLDVQASMHELARPDEVSAGYRAIARSYLPHFLIPLPLAISRFAGMDMFLLIGFVLLIAACYRMWGSLTIRFRASLAQLPVIRPRLAAMFALHLADLLLIAACCILWYAVIASPPPVPSVAALKLVTGGAWLGISLLGLLVTCWASLSVAGMLGYRTCRKELLIHLVLMATSPLTSILLMTAGLLLVLAAGRPIGAMVIRIAGGLSLIAVWALALGYAITAHVRLAGAALHERGGLDDDLIDTGHGAEPAPGPRRIEQPGIRLE